MCFAITVHGFFSIAGAMDAYCIVDVDHPFQTHSTSVVKNTVNPYWDEHFLL